MSWPAPSPSAPETLPPIYRSTRLPPTAKMHIATWLTRAGRRAIAGAVTVGVAADFALRSHPVGLLGALAILLSVLTLIWSGRIRRAGRGALALAVGVTPWLVLRTSPWLIAMNAVALAALFVIGIVRSRPLPTIFLGLRATPETTTAIARASFPTHDGGRVRSIGRGLLIALPLGTSVLLLLASGDRFFASWLGLSSVGARVVDAVVVVVAGLSWLVMVVTSQQHDAKPSETKLRPRRFDQTSATLTLSFIAVVQAGYVASLVAAAVGGRAYVERRAGLTYADYARSGFFQLVVVVLVIISVLMYFRPTLSPHRLALRLLTLAIVAATIAMSMVAVVRLQTYRSVFGLTMLRFGTTVFAAWLGVVVFLVGVVLLRPRLHRHLGVALLLSAYASMTFGNWANPESMIARENITRIHWQTGTTRSVDGAEFDPAYLAGLSDDAVPALVAHLNDLPPEQAAELQRDICDSPHHLDDGWSWNRSREQAFATRRHLCTWG